MIAALAVGLTVVQAQLKAPSLALTSYDGADVLTNVSVTLPVGTFAQGIVYAPVRSLASVSAQAAWTPSLDATGYRFIFGDAKLGTTNTVEVPANVTNIVLFTLNTNISHYFYVKALSATNESPASAVAIFQPSK